MFHPSRLISMLLLALLPAAVASAGNVVDPLVRYSTDYDGRAHSLSITASSTRVTTPDETFRVSTRMVLQYDCHEVAPLHPGKPLQAEAWHFRLPVEAKAAVSVESPANFLADFFNLEPPPFVETSGVLRVTDLGTGGFVETPATVIRSGHGFSTDTVYETQFDSGVIAPERLLRAFDAGHSVGIELESPEFSLSAVFSLTAEQAAPLATVANRCPR